MNVFSVLKKLLCRHADEKEDKFTSPAEGDRLKKERDAVKNYKVPNSDLEVKIVGYPTLTGQFLASYLMCIFIFLHKSLIIDGKIKKEWTKCPHGFWACWVCHAYGIMLGQDLRGTSKFEPKDVEFLKFGFANLHLLKN